MVIYLGTDFKPNKLNQGCLASGLLGGVGQYLLHGLTVVFDKRLLQKTVLCIEFSHFPLDNLIDDLAEEVFHMPVRIGLPQ